MHMMHMKVFNYFTRILQTYFNHIAAEVQHWFQNFDCLKIIVTITYIKKELSSYRFVFLCGMV